MFDDLIVSGFRTGGPWPHLRRKRQMVQLCNLRVVRRRYCALTQLDCDRSGRRLCSAGGRPHLYPPLSAGHPAGGERPYGQCRRRSNTVRLSGWAIRRPDSSRASPATANSPSLRAAPAPGQLSGRGADLLHPRRQRHAALRRPAGSGEEGRFHVPAGGSQARHGQRIGATRAPAGDGIQDPPRNRRAAHSQADAGECRRREVADSAKAMGRPRNSSC